MIFCLSTKKNHISIATNPVNLTCAPTHVENDGVLECTSTQMNYDCTFIEIMITFEDGSVSKKYHYSPYSLAFGDAFSNSLTGLTGPANVGGQYLLLNAEASSNVYILGFLLYVFRAGFIKFEVNFDLLEIYLD